MPNNSQNNAELDLQSEILLVQIQEQERIKNNKVAGVRTVMVVMSSAGMVYDTHALQHEVRLAYPEAAVFFKTSSGKSMGSAAPAHFDLLIDLVGPGQKSPFFFARKLRRGARVAVGRNSGLLNIRKRIYDRIYDEKANMASLPKERLQFERVVQKHVLELAGVALVATGETHPDRGKTIALGLPPMQKL